MKNTHKNASVKAAQAHRMRVHTTDDIASTVVEQEVPESVAPENPFAFTDVRTPRRPPSGIICQVKFVSIDDYLVFLATPDDVEKHGQKIYQECVAGKWGEVIDYVPTDEERLVAAVNKRSDFLAEASQKISDYQDLIDINEATSTDVAMQKEWKKFRVAVTRINQEDGWPQQPNWPEKPV